MVMKKAGMCVTSPPKILLNKKTIEMSANMLGRKLKSTSATPLKMSGSFSVANTNATSNHGHRGGIETPNQYT